MKTNRMARAEEYYKLVGEKNAEGVKKYLHSDVEFYGPSGDSKGERSRH